MTFDQKHCRVENCVQNLFDYALDRGDVKWLLNGLPQESGIDSNTVEYELHLLKIVSVGWVVSYFSPDEEFKNSILEPYWQAVREFSNGLSRTTNLLLGQDIDFFQALKSRLDLYVHAMAKLEANAAPVQAIGSEFARCCGDEANPFAVLLGSKMFASCLVNVQAYLKGAQESHPGPQASAAQ